MVAMPSNYPDDPSPGVPARTIITVGDMPVPACRTCKARAATRHGMCDECHKAYMRDYSQRRYDTRREMVFERLGRKCSTCGRSGPNTNLLIKVQKQFAKDGRNWHKFYTWKKADFLACIEKLRILCKSCEAYESHGFDLKLELLKLWDSQSDKAR